MSTVQLASAVFKADPKREKALTPDENGYYTFLLGALNCYNSYGAYYVARNVIEIFNQSSELTRRIKNGQLRGELGHPKRTADMDLDAWLRRAVDIDPKHVCCHFSEIWLDTEFGKKHPEYKNPDMIAVYGKVKPAGVHGHVLQASIDNPKENVAFSVRSLTDDRWVRNRLEKTILSVITYDYVNEPGKALANKWDTPTMEERSPTILQSDKLIQVLKRNQDNSISTESSRSFVKETIARLEKMSVYDHVSGHDSRVTQW